MRAMGFGPIFVAWVEMLHQSNTTRFILGSLTKLINILFSVRQGNPVAFIFYLLFIEPLLLMIRKMITEVTLGDMKVEDELYVDDENKLITKEKNLLVIDYIFIKF
jgi:hypothetical protein